MSGNCETGMRISDSAPARVNRTAITIASLGRSMKTEEIMLRFSLARCSGGRWRAGRSGIDLDTRADALNAVGNHHFALFQATRDRRGRGRRLPQLNSPLLHLVVGAHDIDVVALLVRQHRLAGNAKRHDGLNA